MVSRLETGVWGVECCRETLAIQARRRLVADCLFARTPLSKQVQQVRHVHVAVPIRVRSTQRRALLLRTRPPVAQQFEKV